MKKPRDKIIGKLLQYQLSPVHHRGQSGTYLGRVVKVRRLKRGTVKSVTIQRPSYDGGKDRFGWRGSRVRLVSQDWQGSGLGVLFRKRIVPVDEFKAA